MILVYIYYRLKELKIEEFVEKVTISFDESPTCFGFYYGKRKKLSYML